MGAFLDKPVVDKVSGCCQLPDGIAYGHSTMQGWRTSQEDAHTCAPGFDARQPDRHLFAVFDGHGGAEVALYLSKHLPQYLLDTDKYQSGDFEQALKDAFLGLDAKLLEPEVAATLKSLAKATDEDSESDQEAMAEEASALREEAEMPLDRLLRTIGAAAAARRRRCNEEGENGDAAAAEEDDASADGSRQAASAAAENENNENTEREAAAAAADDSANGGANDEGAGTSAAATGDAAEEEDGAAPDKEADDDCDDDYVPGAEVEEEEAECAEEEEAEDGEDGDEEEEDDDEEDSDSEEEESEEEYEVIMPTGDDPGVDSGTTAVVALLVGDRLFVANAGDSRAVLSNAGVAVEMSLDHKPEDEPERSRIEAAGGHVTKEGRVNGGLNLSRAIGDHAYKQNAELTAAKQIISPLPDVRSVTITDSHRFLLLACDGIWNSMSSQEAVDFCEKRLSAGLSPDQVCEALFDHCLAPDAQESDGTGCDNMTAVLVCFRGTSAAEGAQQASSRKRLLTTEENKGADAADACDAASTAAEGNGESESKRAKEG